VANNTDTLTGPADSKDTIASLPPPFLPFSGGTVIVSPLIYTVQDAAGTPRNKVCITLYTGGTTGNGIWWSDANYSTMVNGSGALNRIVAVTDDSGRATLYWSSENLPPAIPVTSTVTGTAPPVFTAGKDQTGTSWVKADSGILQTIFNFSWTVSGQPAP
jgi:hypothetical protein